MQENHGFGQSMDLYVPYFRSNKTRRNEEFRFCLQENVNNPLIRRIHLLIDDGHDPEIVSDKIRVIRIGDRPTYQDWLRLALRRSSGAIAVLANTDIYFDETIGLFHTLFDDSKRIVALSRYEKDDVGSKLHKNPHWSQDVWALSVPAAVDQRLLKALDFSLGVPRCDGKVAYTFLIHGYKVHNPCLHVRSYHLHDTPLREYSRKGDRTILGGVAYIHPAAELCSPSKVDLSVWGCDHSQVSGVALNRSIEKWDLEAAIDGPNTYLPAIDCIWLDVHRVELAGCITMLKAMSRPSKNRVRIMIGGEWLSSEKEQIGRFIHDKFGNDCIGSVDFPGGAREADHPENANRGERTDEDFFVRMRGVTGISNALRAVLRIEPGSAPTRELWLDAINEQLKDPLHHDLVLAHESSAGDVPGSVIQHQTGLGNLILCVGNPCFHKFKDEWMAATESLRQAATNPDADHPERMALVGLMNANHPGLAGGMLANDWKIQKMAGLSFLPHGGATVGLDPLTLRRICPVEPQAVLVRSSDEKFPLEAWRAIAEWKKRGTLIHDSAWQYPAITEQHAAIMARSLRNIPEGHIYFGFPWATLIDLLLWNKKDAGPLMQTAETYKRLLRGSHRVVTVCQHIRMLQFQDLFSQMGVTDVFWSHAVKGERTLPEYDGVRIHPFPLFPVQCTKLDWGSGKRKYLYSFIGARTNKSYLTRSRDYILDLLGNDPRGLVKGRDEWHYNKVVYDHQIIRKADNSEGLVSGEASSEFTKVLRQSIFSLCPSGSGPNSIRLWESIAAGAIPVILSDSYLPPGKQDMWKDAAVFCEETEEAIARLPGMLEKIAGAPAEMARKQAAMKQIWNLYGPDGFVHDIEKLFSKYRTD